VKTLTLATTLTAPAASSLDADFSAATLAPSAPAADRGGDKAPKLALRIYGDLAAVETEWRRFECAADCTAFQTFDWLSLWLKHIGLRLKAKPAIVIGRVGEKTVFLAPLCVAADRFARRLTWLGQDLSDYNAPLLAADFAQCVAPDEFARAWRDVLHNMQHDPSLHYDWIDFEKMPQTVGLQTNPLAYLGVVANPSGAHLTHLADDWEKFYTAKRSSATRRRDRAKRQRMSEHGDICFVTATDPEESRRTAETLMRQKSRWLARRGIADLFARDGYREFFLDLATNPRTRQFVHVSRVEVGTTVAAANLGLVFGDCYYHLLASYQDGPLAAYGPGALHLRELMAHAIRSGLKRFDFTIGDEPYKLEWSDSHLKLYDFAAAATWRGVPAYIGSALQRKLKRIIKQTPWLWHLVSSARSVVGSFAPPPRPQAVDTAATKAPPAHRTATPLACVMGDMDLLRPIVLAGIPSAVVARPGVPSLYSRYTQSRLAWDDFEKNPGALVDALVGFGKAHAERPVLFYEEDSQVLLVSRFRERLAEAFRFVVADAGLVEDLLDKGRFQGLAQRRGLPVPRAQRLDPRNFEPADLGLSFPVIVKPLTRLDGWNEAFGLRKALCADDAEALRGVWPELQALGLEVLAQEFILGAENRIESYHCYVDGERRIAAEFTGRKIRTFPPCFGHTTALETTEANDVRRRGRAIVEQLGLTGVAKLDFKRDPRGDLHLLEINPRFNLWHHAGALAGVNIPAFVYADLTGLPRPPIAKAKAGVRWSRVWKDLPAARSSGVELAAWLTWVWGCEAKSALSFDDPLPPLRAAFHRVVGRRL